MSLQRSNTRRPRRQRPPGLDSKAWAFVSDAQNLPRAQHRSDARRALRKLHAEGHPAALNAHIDLAAYAGLEHNARRAYYIALRVAKERQLRTRPLPPRWSAKLRIERSGIDGDALAFLAGPYVDGEAKPGAALWLQLRLRDGLRTDLNCALTDQRTRDLFDRCLRAAERGDLPRGRRARQRISFRRSVRSLYVAARTAGMRRLVIPEFLDHRDAFERGSAAEIRSRLPVRDQDAVSRLESELARLARLNQAGRSAGTIPLASGRHLQITLADSRRSTLLVRLNSFLHHCDEMRWL
jgi:hypothetical protein